MTHTGLLALMHMAVDALCACCLYLWMLAADRGVMALFVTYNVLAFMTQWLVGLWVDRMARGRLPLVLAVALLCLGALGTALLASHDGSAEAMACITAVGMGNALFHVYAGRMVARHSHNDVCHLGIFVSTGALGLVLGCSFRSLGVLGALAAALVLMAAVHLQHWPEHSSRTARVAPSRSVAGPMVLFMLLVVFLRSLVGNVTPDAVERPVLYAALAGVLAFAGKAGGGFVSLALGPMRLLTGALLLSGALYVASMLMPGLATGASLATVLCINLTMPVTLYVANRHLPGHEGLSFGLLATVLLPGYALGTYCTNHPEAQWMLYALVGTMVIEAAVLLAVGERRWQVLAMQMLMNVVTNVPLNVLVLLHPWMHGSLPMILMLECLVVAVEAILYWLVLRDVRRALAYAVLCNTVSYVAGQLISQAL